MTTEIAVVNRLGVALATDSAVTVSGAGQPKVFDTGDKLFELDNAHPVGVMINGNMDFLGVPWEVIIKDFRARDGECHGTMKKWLDELLSFAMTHKAATPESEEQHVHAIAWDEFETIKSQVSRKILRVEDGKERSIESFVVEEARKRIARYVSAGRAQSLKGLTRAQVMALHEKTLAQMIDERFNPVTISKAGKRALTRLVAAALLSAEPSVYSTGIIVAGYGHDDMFPSLAIAEVDGAVAMRLKSIAGEHVIVDRKRNRGRVISFAQTDVVERLLSGADNRFVERSAEYFGEALGNVRDSVKAALEKLGSGTEETDAIFEEIVEAVKEEYRTKFAKEVGEGFQREFNEMVSLMPKQDIIELAEALVSITAIERKASSEQATVGGPVDVAFITRHEGFVWIKRKHYFDKDLNPRFFWRKFGPKGPAERGRDEPSAQSERA